MYPENPVVCESNALADKHEGDAGFHDLVSQAQASAEADFRLTVFQALKKHKKAVFWAMILSTSLVMEGYDLVIVRFFHVVPLHMHV